MLAGEDIQYHLNQILAFVFIYNIKETALFDITVMLINPPAKNSLFLSSLRKPNKLNYVSVST